MAHPLVPLLILFIVVCGAAVVGYVIYSIVTDIADKTSQRMEKKNVTFGREGMKIGVKEVKDDDYVAKTQNVLVNAWNYSTWPAYKSRLWNKEEDQSKAKASGAKQSSSGATKRS